MNEQTPKVSVIVPMYNSEKFLSTCINSVLRQTFEDFELILIDDCSNDNTMEIAKSFEDSRIRILKTEKNLGNPGMARNVGLDAAKGEFFYFVDSDDAILKNTLEFLVSAITASNADIIYCSKWFEPDDANFVNLAGNMDATLRSTSNEPVSKDLKVRIYKELWQHGMHSVLWLCLYRSKVFNGENKIRFPNLLAEDVFVHFDILCEEYKIIKIDRPFYLYRVNPNSLTHSKKDIGKILKTIFYLNKHVREKLLSKNVDLQFINDTIVSVVNGINSIMLLPYFKEDREKFFEEAEEALKKIYGENASNVSMLLYSYLTEQQECLKMVNLRRDLEKVLDRYK